MESYCEEKVIDLSKYYERYPVAYGRVLIGKVVQ